MGQPAARQNDTVVGVDIHIVVIPLSAPAPLPHSFSGTITGDVSSDVTIDGMAAATVGSIARNDPVHVPTPPGVSFQNPPTNRGTVDQGSATVLINGRPAARLGDRVKTCNDPIDLPNSFITSGSGTVMIG